MSSEKTVWQDLLRYVEKEIPEMEFRTWFKQIKPISFENDSFVLGVPHGFARDWLKTHYSSLLDKGLQEIGGLGAKVHFEVAADLKSQQQQELFVEAEEEEPPKVDPPTSLPRFNSKYTFDNFVVGANNNLATAAARAIVKTPGKAYNPLFLYGDSGLGKTHLMHAVGQAVIQQYPHMVVQYVTTEAFTNDLINAIHENKMVAFRDRYRTIDVLLVDDVQFIAGKERTQDEFFHTFNALHEAGKQIILSSDRPPREIPTLENRLRSRFEWGLITDIQSPDFETRIAILKMNAGYRQMSMPDEVFEYIADNISTNIRELEGALVRVIVHASMSGQTPSRQLAAKALSDVFTDSNTPLTMEDILRVVARHFDVSEKDMLSKGRRADIVTARQTAMYLIRDMTEHSFPEIGNFFSGRDHTTVMYAMKKVKKRSKNPQFQQDLHTIRQQLS